MLSLHATSTSGFAVSPPNLIRIIPRFYVKTFSGAEDGEWWPITCPS